MSFYATDNSISSSLRRYTNEELKNLLNNDQDQKIEQLVNELPQVKSLETERELLIASNKSLAEYNISREPSYRQVRQALLTSHREANELKKQVESHKEKLEEINRQTSLDTTLALLQTAAAEAEEESEAIANSFLASELTLDAFLSQFLEKRKLSHLRRIKTDKLMEYVRKNSGYNQMSAAPYPSRPAPAPPTYGGVAPYPPLANPMNQMPLGYSMNTDLQPNHFPFSRPDFGR